MSIVIVTDTLCDLSPELVEKAKIKSLLPLGVKFDGDETEYYDGITITPDEIYARVDKTGTLPKTSAVTTKQFYEAFKKELDEGNEVFYVGAGSGISSTYQNACIAREQFENKEKIAISDSMTLSTGIGLLILKARKYIDEGKSLNEIKELIDKHALNSSVKFCINRLDYLYKGGRCSTTSFLLGNFVHIHPVIKVVDNKLIVAKKPMGKYEKAMDEQIKEFERDLKKVDLDCVFITHSGPAESKDYEYIYNKLIKYVPEENLHITRAAATVTCHCGPRTIGILYLFKI